MGEKFNEVYNNMLNAYKRTGKIGATKPRNLEHAKRVAWVVTQKIIINNNKNKANTITWPSRQGTEPLTGCPCYCQLKLF